ncbi:MAG: hypothetical protein CM1200mP41_26330 [Gammaproteobacteria bacterium]|nr:MAG: hypothetical protein CM1200mP41_26330 [Gammaproteobacteria bacterium]
MPNSPYSASKAASDHLVRPLGETFRLNTVVSNCSNNYGPYQFPEKLIPVIVQTALRGKRRFLCTERGIIFAIGCSLKIMRGH